MQADPLAAILALLATMTPGLAFAEIKPGPCDLAVISEPDIGLMSIVPIGWDFSNNTAHVGKVSLWEGEHFVKMDLNHWDPPDRVIYLQPGEKVLLPAATPEQAERCTAKPVS